MKWYSAEIKYLEDHANEGSEAIAKALGRTVQSVKLQASRYGISLKQRWQCPKCGQFTSYPLSPKTGWCANCTKEKRIDELAEEVRELEEEVRREERNNRERQRLYNRKHNARKKLKK